MIFTEFSIDIYEKGKVVKNFIPKNFTEVVKLVASSVSWTREKVKYWNVVFSFLLVVVHAIKATEQHLCT